MSEAVRRPTYAPKVPFGWIVRLHQVYGIPVA